MKHDRDHHPSSDTSLPMPSSFLSRAPCRICLFGEHQDYLDLPVIAISIPYYCRIRVQPTAHHRLVLEIPQLQLVKEYDLSRPLPDIDTTTIPDFALNGLHVALSQGWQLCGAHCIATTDIPMQAGCSTSTAFMIAWLQALAYLEGVGTSLTALQLAQLAHHAEVTLLQAPGGTMDHVTCAIGGAVRIGAGKDPWCYQPLPMQRKKHLGVWVLIYTGEPKDTLSHLHRCKQLRLDLYTKLNHDWYNDAVDLTDDETALLQATRTNLETEATAARIWNDESEDNVRYQRLGALMNAHLEALRDGLRLSTSKLEHIRNVCLAAGAVGFKLVGSGGGGCGVAWTANAVVATTVRRAVQAAGYDQVWTVEQAAFGACVVPDER